MTKEQNRKKIQEILSKDKRFIGTNVKVDFSDKKTNTNT